MRSDFEQASYNVNEHNHSEWSDEQLRIERERLLELAQPWQCEERLTQIMGRVALIEYEQDKRYPTDEIQDEIDKAWSEYGAGTSSTPELA